MTAAAFVRMKSETHAVELLIEQVRVSACSDENNGAEPSVFLNFIGQQKIPTDMALSMTCPFALQWMIEPLRSKWPLGSDYEKHRFL